MDVGCPLVIHAQVEEAGAASRRSLPEARRTLSALRRAGDPYSDVLIALRIFTTCTGEIALDRLPQALRM